MAETTNYKNLFNKNNNNEAIIDYSKDSQSDSFLNSLGQTQTEEGSSGTKIKLIKYPLNISKENDLERFYKTLNLYILKEHSYVQTLEKMTQNLIEGGKAFADGVTDSLSTLGTFLTQKVPGEGDSEKTITLGDTVGKVVGNLAEGTVTGMIKAKDGFRMKPFDTEKMLSEDFHAVFQLPIPNSLMENEAHNYSDGSFENAPIISAAYKAYGEFRGGMDNAVQAGFQMKNEGTGFKRTSQSMPQMPVLNPYLWQKYNGSGMKTFTFVFFFVPQSMQEAQNMMQIVYTLKKFSYPSKTIPNESDGKSLSGLDSMLITPPPKVLIKFNNPMLQKMINPGVCVIKNIGVTYQEGTTIGMTADGIPRFIELNLTLDEFNQRFQEDF